MRAKALALLALSAVASVATAQLRIDVHASGLASPLAFIQDPVNPGVQYAVEQDGLIRVVQNGAIVGTFLDLTSQTNANGEQGLLGLVFAPDYAASGRFYVNYTDLSGTTQVVRYNRSPGNPFVADPGSAFKILSVAQPFENHNGGTLRFGPDGMLYIGMGDGGDGYDPGNRAQSPNTLLGKMLRINPSVDDFPGDPNRNYGIPANNPFPPGNPLGALSEIWAFGYRNPWKFTFDDPARGGTGAMLIGDVGQDSWEEVDYEPAGKGGRNYGWRVLEGTHPTGLGGQSYGPLQPPILEYSHAVGHSITGGYVYRGWLMGNAFRGRYFYADFIFRKLFSARIVTDAAGEGSATDIQEHTAALGGAAALGMISSIDVDSNGELFLVDYAGRVLRLTSQPTTVNPTSYSLFRGALVAGTLANLTASDNAYLTVRPGPVLSAAEAPIQVVVEGTSPVNGPAVLRLLLEANSSESNIQQKVEFYNFSAGRYDTIDTRTATRTDSTISLTLTNAGAYVNAADRKIRARLSWRPTGPVLSYPWVARTDRATWEILP